MTCGLALAVAVAAIVAGPMCPRADRVVPGDVMAALRGESPAGAADPSELRAAIAALAPAPSKRRRRR